MNQGRIWCVVHPTVGLPLLLGGVTLIALTVHYNVLSRTTWMSSYWQGGAKAKAADLGSVSPVASANVTPNFAVSVSQVPASDGKGTPSFVVTVTPRSDQNDVAAADAPPRNAVLADSGTPLR